MAAWFILPEGMRQFMAFSVQRSQLPYTILLACVILYWLLVIVTAFDLDVFGIDIDDSFRASNGPFHWFFSLFNIGELPIMIIVSLAVVGFWTTAMITGMFVPATASTLIRLVLFPINLVLGALLAVPIIKPIAWLFKQNEKAREVIREVGSLAHLRTALEPDTMGQAMIKRPGAPVMLNVKLVMGESRLEAGTEVVVVASEGSFFRVKKFS